MNEYLIDYVRRNVWCNPYQDNQWILSMRRISRRIGELNRFQLMQRSVDLPVKAARFHIFQVGQINPELLGLMDLSPTWRVEKWKNLAETMVSKKLIANFYNTSGIELPRGKIYYMFSNERALVFAIQEDKKIPVDYQTGEFFLRVYSNAFFESARADTADETIQVYGKTILNLSEVTTIQALYSNWNSKPGYVYAYRNGRIVDRLDAGSMAVGDSIEMVFDGSVKRVVTFTLQDLPSFESDLDNVFKYLLHHNSNPNDTIDYQDDIDVFVMAPNRPGRLEGLYYHRNDITAHRMVTHRDYSVPVNHVNFVVERIKELVTGAPIDGNTYSLRVVVRQAGYYRPLVYENSRIFELYKLSDEKALAAMVGLESSLDLWRAETLENNAYTSAMRSRYVDINQTLTQEVLGYNGMSKVTGDTPVKTVLNSSQQMAALPEGLQRKSTIYMYDFNGHLIGTQLHSNQQYVIAQNSGTRMIEAIYGHGSLTPEVLFGTDEVSIPLEHNYRVYRCYIVGGEENNDWEDITGTAEYSIVNRKVKLSAPAGNEFLMVRNDGSFLDFEIDLEPLAGTFFFTLFEHQDRGEGLKPYALPVPLGELDVFLNKKALIRDLDYKVEFPKITIVNKAYLVQPIQGPQKIHVRFTGFASSSGQLDEIEDYGFVHHGYLSDNNRHDIRDDKVLRITLDGSVKHRDDLQFSEDHDGISVTNPINGQPYQIKDIVVPLHGLEGEDTYSARSKSILIDKLVSDYLTVKLPEPDRGMNAVVQRHVLFSPFFSRIIFGLKEGTLTGAFDQNLSDMDVIHICQPFEPLLQVDPINEDNQIDYRYVVVHPHSSNNVVSLEFFKYRFLTKVVKLYGRNMVDLNSHVSVE